MPEFPEVETTCRGLNEMLELHDDKKVVIERVVFTRDNIRNKIPKLKLKNLEGQQLHPIKRRAKYLLFPTEQGVLLNHLGMSGYWRELPDKQPLKTHDHCWIHFSNGKTIVYNDARRFGIIDFIARDKESQNSWLKNLGVEPLDKTFNSDYLQTLLRSRKAPIKNVIMDQKIVVGVGNIYASEALFLAKIHPQTMANKISQQRLGGLVNAIKKVLNNAIRAGGTTIRDFRQAGGEQGYFVTKLKVYGRLNELCKSCSSPIKAKIIGGRNSFWCSKCQQR